jgi:DivIVA domain-containing protein
MGMLTPRDISMKRFTNTRFREGYDQEEVDSFLDRVHEDYDYLWTSFHAEKQKAQREAKTQKLPVVTEVKEPPSAMLAKILAVAEETAEKHIHEGKVQAEQIRLKAKDDSEALMKTARDSAQSVINAANAEAEELKRQGTEERHREIGALEDKRAQVQARVDELVRAEEEVTARLRKALEGWT